MSETPRFLATIEMYSFRTARSCGSSLTIDPTRFRAIAAEVLAIRVVLASYLPAAAIGVFQAIILYCVVRFALGMQVVHPVAMLGFMIRPKR